MQSTIEKKGYFDNYWREQPEAKVDPRSLQRADYVQRLMQNKSGSLLDVGCGRGLISDYFEKLRFNVTGVDISPDMVELVKENGHKAFVLDLERDEINEGYDMILCLEVLQQLYNPELVLNKLKAALNDEGELIVSVPNEFHIVSRLKLFIGKSHLGDFKHSHIRLFSPARDKLLFEKTDLRIQKRMYVPIVPPKWKVLSAIFKPLVQICPSLFAISSIYTLRKA